MGCGKTPRNPLNAEKVYGVDVTVLDQHTNDAMSKTTQVICHDLSLGIPFESDSLDSISAFDFLEHLPRWERIGSSIEFPFVKLMSEVFRTLKPGGYFLALTPGVPRIQAFTDPTHVNFISIQSAEYFCSTSEHVPSGAMYGFQGVFRILHNGWLRGGGPNLKESLLTKFNSESSSNVDKLIVLLKITKRVVRMLRIRKPSHIYWVFQKPHA